MTMSEAYMYGISSEVACECVTNDAGEINSGDCPVHTDPDGKPYKNGVCCPQYDVDGRHEPGCGNFEDGQ